MSCFLIKHHLDVCNSHIICSFCAPSMHLPTCICHDEPLVLLTIVINCVVPYRFTVIVPAVRDWVCRHQPWCAMVKQIDKRQSMHVLRWACRCLFRTLNLFVLPPTFIQTLLFDNEVCPTTFDRSWCPHAAARGGDYDCHKTALAPSPLSIRWEKQ